MQRWLYWLANFGYTQGHWRLQSEREEAVGGSGQERPTLFDYLNDQGAQGWELVAAVNTENGLNLILKQHRSE